MMIARVETSRRLQDNWIEQVEDHKIIREEVPRYKYRKLVRVYSRLQHVELLSVRIIFRISVNDYDLTLDSGISMLMIVSVFLT